MMLVHRIKDLNYYLYALAFFLSIATSLELFLIPHTNIPIRVYDIYNVFIVFYAFKVKDSEYSLHIFSKNLLLYFIPIYIFFGIAANVLYATGNDNVLMWREIIAFSYLFLIVCFLSSLKIDLQKLTMCFYKLSITLIFFFLMAHIISGETERFRALSNNPNQLALVIIIFPFYVLYLVKQKIDIFNIFIIIISIFLIIYTSSYATYVCWAAAFGVYISQFKKGRYFLVGIMGICALGIYYICMKYGSFFDYLKLYHNHLYKEVFVRLEMSGLCIMKWFHHPLGSGFGSTISSEHFGYEFEEHNSFLQILHVGGIIPFIVFVLYVGTFVSKIFKRHSYIYIAGTSSVLLFAFAHNILRHPLFYLYLMLFYAWCRNNDISSKDMNLCRENNVRNK